MTFGTLKPGLLVDPAAGHAGAVGWSTSGSDTARRAGTGGAAAADVAALLPEPARGERQVPAGRGRCRRGLARGTRAPRCSPSAGALRGGAGMVRYVGPAAGRGDRRAARRSWSHARTAGQGGRVQAWVVGRASATTRRVAIGRRAGTERAGAGRRGRAAPAARRAVRLPGGATLLTPHAGEAAALLGVSREESRRRGCRASVRWPPGTARRCCSRARRPGRSPRTVGPCGSTRPAHPGWPRRARGDVLSGLHGLPAGRGPGGAGGRGPWAPICTGSRRGRRLAGRSWWRRMWRRRRGGMAGRVPASGGVGRGADPRPPAPAGLRGVLRARPGPARLASGHPHMVP